MKNEIKPLWIGLAAIGAVILLGVLYKVFLAEPPMPAAVTREEEMKHKGMNAKNYAGSYKQQFNNPQGGQSGQGRYGQGYGQGYGGQRPGGMGGYSGAPSGYGGQGGYGGR